jgi:hypothetical protein
LSEDKKQCGETYLSLRIPRLGQHVYVVHHAMQVPLRFHLDAAVMVQPCQALFVADVAKHRRCCAYALARLFKGTA